MKPERLYYHDSCRTEFHARVIEAAGGGLRVYLDRTAFYPTSGGQPHDTGTINGAPVVEVIDEGDRILHVTAAPVAAGEAECRIDWPRRFDHMQQHTGQHLLSAVLAEMYGAGTVGFHLGAGSATIDVSSASLDAAQIAAAELRVNQLVFEDRPVSVTFEEASDDLGLRKRSERTGTLRIISIEGVDRSACGGTHVRRTGEIGPVLLRKVEKAHGATRIEFLCGLRAVRRARADYDALAQIGRTFSAQLDETPALVAAQYQALDASEKARRRLAAEVARARGREAYQAAPAGEDGIRRMVKDLPKGSLDDELRAEAQGFTGNPKAIFLAAIAEPPAVLLACSADSGVHAGNEVKALAMRFGGRGGGNAQLAQAGLPTAGAVKQALAVLNALPRPR
jgi:alanyl-tRNA synthetase